MLDFQICLHFTKTRKIANYFMVNIKLVKPIIKTSNFETFLTI